MSQNNKANGAKSTLRAAASRGACNTTRSTLRANRKSRRAVKQGPGRPSMRALQRSPKPYVPIVDAVLQDQVQSYLWMGSFRKDARIFAMARQTVNRHLQRLVARLGGAYSHQRAYISTFV